MGDVNNIAVSLNLTDVMALTVVGALISFILQYIKNAYGATSGTAKLLLILFALVIGAVYWFVRDTAYWVNIVGILTIASTVYALFIKDSPTLKTMGTPDRPY